MDTTMTSRHYIAGLSIGVAMTPSGGVAIGGLGIWDARVKSVAQKLGLKMHPLTGEWFSATVPYGDVLKALQGA